MSLIFILLGTFFLLAFLGVPIAISLGVASGRRRGALPQRSQHYGDYKEYECY